MTDKLTLKATVTYGDVDRDEVMLLPRVFKLLQDAAIEHANLFGSGTKVVATRGESWVLNRMTAEIERYPRAGDTVRVETWSSGIRGFKGYRDFRAYDADDRLILSASSLWLYISLKTKSIIRVPRELAEIFPVGRAPAWCPDIDRLPVEEPSRAAIGVPVTLRYSDFDVNQHVNNTAYLDFVQTALGRAGADVRPRRVVLKYTKELPPDVTDVEVRVEKAGATARFSIESGDTVYAHGETLGELLQ